MEFPEINATVKALSRKFQAVLEQSAKDLNEFLESVQDKKPRPFIDVKFRQFVKTYSLIEQCDSTLHIRLLESQIEVIEKYGEDGERIGEMEEDDIRIAIKRHFYEELREKGLSEIQDLHVLGVMKCSFSGAFAVCSEMKEFFKLIAR